MAKIKKPTKTKIELPILEKEIPEVTSTLSPQSDLKNIQFRVPGKIHHEMKMYSCERGMTMTELFIKMFDEYRANHR